MDENEEKKRAQDGKKREERSHRPGVSKDGLLEREPRERVITRAK